MTIPLKKEPDEFKEYFHGAVENCFFCSEPTVYWHENTNNPVCQKCAKLHKVSSLPDFGKDIRRRKRLRLAKGNTIN